MVCTAKVIVPSPGVHKVYLTVMKLHGFKADAFHAGMDEVFYIGMTAVPGVPDVTKPNFLQVRYGPSETIFRKEDGSCGYG